jgi:hypothetical protein
MAQDVIGMVEMVQKPGIEVIVGELDGMWVR